MTEVFVKKDAKPQAGFNIGVILNKKITKGLVGIEIEVEGKKLPRGENVPAPWVYHEDHSLRGEENGEYVLRSPVEFGEVPESLQKLWDKFRANGTSLEDSNRTSVHVHLNCQSFFFNRLTALMALYFTFEEILVEWCGEHRVGNLFCLRAKDAPAIVSQLRRFITSDGKYNIQENHHYAGLNANALSKFGSLEFRTLRGCSDQQTILDWVSILERLYNLSGEFNDPREICGMFSGEGPLAFFNTVFGEQASVVRKGIDWDDDDIRESLYEGIRMAQDLCYCRDWGMFKGIELKVDPFGRDARMIAKKIAAMGPVTAEGFDMEGMMPNWEPDTDEDEGPQTQPVFAPNQLQNFIHGTAPTDTWIFPPLPH